MKFNFPLIVFDLETTDCTNHHIIEIGAVSLDEKLKRAGDFQTFVRPPAETPISTFVTGLTGITESFLEKAHDFAKTRGIFEKFVTEAGQGNIKRPRLAAWGSYFDVGALRKHYEWAGVEYPFSGAAICVKSIALAWAALAGKWTDKMNVQRAMEYLGLKPIGDYHHALVDADATARILSEIMGRLDGGCYLEKELVKLSKFAPSN